MTIDTINDAHTIAGNAEWVLFANRYRVVRQLGQGGMGSVWLAEDTQLDNKPFAIKMLPAILVSNKRAYRQLKDEALVAMQLVHPNIVQIRAFEENNGNPFLVMDYIDGQTLDDYLAEHTGTTGVSPVACGLPEVDTMRILRPIAAALDYAHSKGVVHRDVKPGNVMIANDGTPYILDFGIAREIQETLTRVTGKLSSGTLLYMSPEQLMGEQPKPAQDIYSFAAMAYECLKGEPPFSHGQIEFQIMNQLPDPLATDALTGNAAILAAGVMAGLAKKPEARPATCAAVLEGSCLSRIEHVERVDGVGRTRTPDAPQGRPRPVAAVRTFLAVAALASFALVVCSWWWMSWREKAGKPTGTTETNVVQVATAPSSASPKSTPKPPSTVPKVPIVPKVIKVPEPLPAAPAAAENLNEIIEEEKKKAQAGFDEIICDLKRLDWERCAKHLTRLKESMRTCEGKDAVDDQIKKVKFMEGMHKHFITHAEKFVFRDRRGTALAIVMKADDKTLTIQKVKDVKGKPVPNKEKREDWSRFYGLKEREYLNYMNQFINELVLKGRERKRINSPQEWSEHMFGAALTLHYLYGEEKGVDRFIPVLVNKAVKDFEPCRKWAVKWFPEVELEEPVQ